MPLTCNGWTSSTATIILPNGVAKVCTMYTTTGCKNTTAVLDPSSQTIQTVLLSVDVYYPFGSQDPVRIVTNQDLWDGSPSSGVIHTHLQAVIDIAKFDVGSCGPASFSHCSA